MWGCTYLGDPPDFNRVVFPTHVGVYLTTLYKFKAYFTFSPRMWGCTYVSPHIPAASTVFPTHVGVYRRR